MSPMTEPAVALTDFGLSLECAAFVVLLMKSPQRPSHRWFALFFASLGLGAFFGGAVHGFFLEDGPVHRVLWCATLLCLGVTAWSEWAIAARMLWPPPTARRVTAGASLLLAVYVGVVLFVSRTFFTAIVHYLPPSLLLFAALISLYRRRPSRDALLGVAGMGLTFAAAGVQAGQVSPHPVYFNHNALYHLIQAAALLLLFRTASRTAWEREA